MLGVVELTEGGDRLELYATIGSPDIKQVDIPITRPELVTQPRDVLVVDDMPADPRYYGSPAVLAGTGRGLRPEPRRP